ncbi:MAG TPA: tetratricopeptide repeat protein [Gammaproteobacteria bacterium]|nr:tetratricopeptide repeat protein [Gammaproteobacteria bacterium]
MTAIERLKKLLDSGRDSAMLRYALGDAYLKAKNPAAAADHLRQAVNQEPEYSAAWKLLGKALAEDGSADDAAEAYRRGISVAEQNGDVQAAKEMRVFLKRLEKSGS